MVVVVLVVATFRIRDWESPWKLPSHVPLFYCRRKGQILDVLFRGTLKE